MIINIAVIGAEPLAYPAWTAAHRALGDVLLDLGGALDADASDPHGAHRNRALEGLQLAEVTVRVAADDAGLHAAARPNLLHLGHVADLRLAHLDP